MWLLQTKYVGEGEKELKFEKSSLPKHFIFDPTQGNLVIKVHKEHKPGYRIIVSHQIRVMGLKLTQ